jgi:hypothetical protein
VVVLLGCASCTRAVSPPVDAGPCPEPTNREVDVLFMIDNSVDTERAQERLHQATPAFVAALDALPDGAPDLHIAVITSDLGASDGSIAGCNATGGDRGAFRAVPSGTCATSTLDGKFISRPAASSGQPPNYSGDLASVLACIVPMGGEGCGYERPLASVARALGTDGKPAPLDNAAFLRPEAALAIILLTVEDDCSATDEGFYTTSMGTLASTLGPSGNFRCAEFGHLCSRDGGAPRRPARMAPNGMVSDTITYDACVPAEEAGRLTPVHKLVDGIRALKGHPQDQIMVASIQGPRTPYEVHWIAPGTTGDGPWPSLTHSCPTDSLINGDPGIRVGAFAEQLGGEGLVFSICEASYAPAMEEIARRIGELRGCP